MATTFCFGTSGTWSPFHVGVAMYILENIPFDRSAATAYVISGGALGLTLLLYDDPNLLYQRMRETCEIMAELKRFGPLAPFHTTRICRKGLNHMLPDDAHLRLGDRVYVGLTRFPSFRAVVKQGPFLTKEALIDALMASSFIPGFFAVPFPRGYSGYIDGGFSHTYGPEPERSVVVTLARYPISDVSYDSEQLHLRFSDAEGYMRIFWLGYYCAHNSHERIVRKLQQSKNLLPLNGLITQNNCTGSHQ